MSKIVINAAYRKARGTDKPFSGSDEQAKAIWNKLIRKEPWRSTQETPATKPVPAT
jgi:hypothetical protein